ncbi:MAG TPA: DJ-1/PfpI family protein [Opitutaceae bacterium]|nr:DJ-1/PfpI family protein [Opitutaceae bacterium]
MPTVLAILTDGFEEIETVAPIDLLRRAGVEVTLAALGPGIHATGRSGLTLHADSLLEPAGGPAYDCLFLPGGPGVKTLRADPRVRQLVLAQHARNGWLAAICAAPTVLHDAGLLRGRNYTAHFSVANELPELRGAERCVVDGNLITSRGAGTAIDFGLLLVAILVSPQKSAEIAASICA